MTAGGECGVARRRRWRASHCRRSRRRSSSEVPPHTPESWLVASANSRHCDCTGQMPHTALAASICSIAGPGGAHGEEKVRIGVLASRLQPPLAPILGERNPRGDRHASSSQTGVGGGAPTDLHYTQACETVHMTLAQHEDQGRCGVPRLHQTSRTRQGPLQGLDTRSSCGKVRPMVTR